MNRRFYRYESESGPAKGVKITKGAQALITEHGIKMDQLPRFGSGSKNSILAKDIKSLIGKPAPAAARSTTNIDDLTQIKGVGEARSKELKAAGYNSLQDIADAQPEELEKVIDDQLADPVSFIQQAKELIKNLFK